MECKQQLKVLREIITSFDKKYLPSSDTANISQDITPLIKFLSGSPEEQLP